jgi:hypothetical protein
MFRTTDSIFRENIDTKEYFFGKDVIVNLHKESRQALNV